MNICPFRRDVFCFNPFTRIGNWFENIASEVLEIFLKTQFFKIPSQAPADSREAFLIRCTRIEQSEPHDEERFRETTQFLKSFGGVKTLVHPEDDPQAEVECVLMTPEGFFSKLRELGGDIETTQDGISYMPLNGVLRKPLLEQFGFREYVKQDEEGNERSVIILPMAVQLGDDDKRPLILECPAFGQVGYDLEWIALHLAAGASICVYMRRDKRAAGTSPKEGKLYLDAKAVLNHVLEQGYEPRQIWASGLCSGAATAGYLQEQYIAQGMNLVCRNAFDSPYGMNQDNAENFSRFRFLQRIYRKVTDYITSIAIRILKLNHPEIQVNENGFDLLARIQRAVRNQSNGKFLFFSTQNDPAVSHKASERLFHAARVHSEAHHYIWENLSCDEVAHNANPMMQTEPLQNYYLTHLWNLPNPAPGP